MKRILATLLILLSFTAMGQKINKDVLGIHVGGYGTPQGVSRILENKYGCYSRIYQKSSSYTVSTRDIPFAGNSWDQVAVNITSNKRIAEVILLDVYESKDNADKTFDSLVSMLQEKYGAPAINLSDYKNWGEGTHVSIERQTIPSKSNPDKTYYRVELSYYNKKYSCQLSTDIIDEL